ncbi:MAG TPA: CRTAC1 family protein [Verrucomicrobiae bacterium]|nr:CRTAC1 family protein [Verrucomicrobiae bacterium]
MLSRRRFLHHLGQAGLLAALPRTYQNLPAFEEIPASASGIHWKHVGGLSREMYLPETSGPGCAFIDYDNDGWMDIYLVNSGKCDFYNPPQPLRNALYHNNRDGTFTDVTARAGVPGNAYGMGVAVGDYDGDGWPDLYVTQYPRSVLYHNNGDGTFTDVTENAGLAAPGWSTSAVWFDYDNDGRLDLIVGSFVEFDKAKNQYCGDGSLRWYCMPTVYKGAPCRLFHNNGDGTFTDVSRETGIGNLPAKAWGLVSADFNDDGWMDVAVANDKVANFLLTNRKGRFEDIGLVSGVGYNVMGQARSGMGVDAADFDQDGSIDLFITNLDHEQFSLYRNLKRDFFDDVAITTGIGAATMLFSGWGCRFFDYDNDGELDLITCNGHPDTAVERRFPQVKYSEPMLLFRNNGAKWTNVSAQSGPVFTKALAGRGLALGDFNNDGSVDVLVTVNDGPPVLLRNNAGRANHWLGVRLAGRKANPDAIGAKVTYRSGEFQRHRWLSGGGSYLSSHDPRLVLGLGQRNKVDWLEVKWPPPSGSVQRFDNLPVDRYITIVEGEGRWK